MRPFGGGFSRTRWLFARIAATQPTLTTFATVSMVVAFALSPLMAAAQVNAPTRSPGEYNWGDVQNFSPPIYAATPQEICEQFRARGGYTDPVTYEPVSTIEGWCVLRTEWNFWYIGAARYGRHCPLGYLGQGHDVAHSAPVSSTDLVRYYGGSQFTCVAFPATIEQDLSSPPRVCGRNSCVRGNPIEPLSGAKVERFGLGTAAADGMPFELVYNSSVFQLTTVPNYDPLRGEYGGGPPLLLTTDGAAPPRLTAGTPGMLAGWNLSAFKRLHLGRYLSGDFGATKAVRADGTFTFFSSLPEGSMVKAANADDRLKWTSTRFEYYARREGRVEIYGYDNALRNAYLTQQTDLSGYSVALSYSTASAPINGAPGEGYLVSAVDSFGRQTNLFYTDGLLSSIAFADGTAVSLAQGQGVLSQLSWSGGETLGFEYSGGLLTGKRDALGVLVGSYSYDGFNRASSSSGANGVNSYSVAYTVPPKIIMSETAGSGGVTRRFSFTMPQGVQVTGPLASEGLEASDSNGFPVVASRSQAAGSGSAAGTTSINYDANGNVASHDDWNGLRTCYASDLNRNLETARIEGLAGGASGVLCSSVTPEGSTLPPGARKVSTQWHPDWVKASKVAEPGRITTSVYNGQPDPFNGDVPASCAPSSARLPDNKSTVVLCKQVQQATTDATGAAGFAAAIDTAVPARVSQWTYNQFGQVLTAVDALNRTTTYSYYADTAFSGADPNAVGHTLGDLYTVTNAAGHVTQYAQYNKHGNWLQMVDPNGVVTNRTFDLRQRLLTVNVAGQLTSYEYWPTGLLKKLTQPDGSFVSYEYDAAHRLVALADNLGNRIEYTLDNAGNRTAENVKDPGGSLRRVVARSVDALGRVQQTTGRE